MNSGLLLSCRGVGPCGLLLFVEASWTRAVADPMRSQLPVGQHASASLRDARDVSSPAQIGRSDGILWKENALTVSLVSAQRVKDHDAWE